MTLIQFVSVSRRQRRFAHGLSEKLRNPKPLTIVLSSLKEMAYFAPSYLGQFQTTNVCAENINA